MSDAPDSDVGMLKFLRILVTTLTVVMIVGFLVLIGFLVTRFPDANASAIDLPEQIILPENQIAIAYTQGTDWWAVVTDLDNILIFDRKTGALRQTVKVKPAP